MAITFDGPNKRIILSTGTVTLSMLDLWSRYVDWLAIGDNSKYTPALRTVGRDEDDIALYVFLNDTGGWTIIPQAADHTLSVEDGVLKTESGVGGNPFTAPAGNYMISIRLKEPGVAIGYNSNGSSGPSAAEIAASLISALNATTIPVDMKKQNGVVIIGDGTEGNKFRSINVG